VLVPERRDFAGTEIAETRAEAVERLKLGANDESKAPCGEDDRSAHRGGERYGQWRFAARDEDRNGRRGSERGAEADEHFGGASHRTALGMRFDSVQDIKIARI